jgi:hypothetical protein
MPIFLAHGIEVGAGMHDVLPIHHDLAGAGFFEPVAATQHGALARTGRADHADQLARPHAQVDPAQDGIAFIGLVQADDF